MTLRRTVKVKWYDAHLLWRKKNGIEEGVSQTPHGFSSLAELRKPTAAPVEASRGAGGLFESFILIRVFEYP
jgi:hypothetical protein